MREIMGSTLFMTASARAQNVAADLLSRGDIQGALRILTAVGAQKALQHGESITR